MNAIHVWLRPLGESCRVHVNGMGNAKWLLERLSQSFFFKTSQPFVKTAESSVCSWAHDALRAITMM